MTARCAYALMLVQLISPAADGTSLVLHSVRMNLAYFDQLEQAL